MGGFVEIQMGLRGRLDGDMEVEIIVVSLTFRGIRFVDMIFLLRGIREGKGGCGDVRWYIDAEDWPETYNKI